MYIESENKYKMSVVAFIDILGFTEMIKKSAESPNDYARIWSALRVMKRWKKDYKKKYSKTISTTMFSDSIVISNNSDNIMNALKNIIEDVMYLQEDLLRHEILCRGGISIGKLYHSKNKMFGPAFLEAYRLESEEAKYPRIVLSKSAVEKFIKANNNVNNNFSLFNDIQNDYLQFDEENPDILYVDYLHKFITKRNQQIEEFINNELEQQKGNNVISKYQWLMNYWKSFTHIMKEQSS